MSKRALHKRIRNACVYICIIILMLTILPVPDAVHAETPEQGKIIVSLGDSYSSGEGIEKFYGQDEDISKKIENPDWLAHRSENSWPGMLTLESVDGPMSKHRGTNWYFAAASGAKTKHMKKSQSKEYDRDGYSAYGDAAPLLDAQINIFDEMEGQKADYVTLTLGGNDAGFQNIIVSGAMKSSYLCNDLPDLINTTWEEFEKEGGIRDDLRQAYEDIAEAAGKQATVIVAGYPCLLDPDGIGAFYSKDEAGIINKAVHNFNLAIEEIVESCENSDINICFVSVEEGFAGHEAYAKEPYINEIMLSQPEDLKRNKKASIMNAFSAYSIHPNIEGAKIYAECVQKKINELERGKGKPSDVEESPVSEEQSSKEDEMRALFGENCIAEQTFKVNLSEYEGSVYFVPYYPEEGESDCKIQIIQDGEVLAELDSYIHYLLENESFTSLDAVSFFDVNFDGNTDIVMIKTVGTNRYVAVYYGKLEAYNGGRPSFLLQKCLSEQITDEVNPHSISEIQFFLTNGKKNGEFSDYQEAYRAVSKLIHLESGGKKEYNLIYVDNDDIPELVAGSSGYNVSLYTFDNGSVYTLMDAWPYGAMGNKGYEYAPRNNSLRNYNSDYAGMIMYTTYMCIDDTHSIENVASIKTLYFTDSNGNYVPDDGEDYLEEGISYIDDVVVTKEECESYDTGSYEYIEPYLNYENILIRLGG